MKKGFTLIELLAVIVILAIILAIAIPGITSIIYNAKKATFENNTKVVLKSLKIDYDSKMANGTYNDTFILYENGVKTTYPSSNDVDFTVSAKDGGIVIHEDGTITMALYDGTYCVTKLRDSNDVITTTTTKEDCISNVYYRQASEPFNNFVINGDFNNGSSGWTTVKSSVIDGRMRTYSSGLDAYFCTSISGLNSGNYVYTKFDFEHVSGALYINNTNAYSFSSSGTFSLVYQEDNSAFLFDNSYGSNVTDYYVDNIIGINLTSVYGPGNEPTKIQMDNNLNKVWIDTTTNTAKHFTAGGWVGF